jgi:hypothetical protein
MRRAILRATVGALLLSAGGSASENKVALNDLPPALRQQVLAETRGDVLIAISKTGPRGHVLYEVDTKRENRRRIVVFTDRGRVTSVERELDPRTLPPAVQKTLATLGTVLTAASVTKGTVITYKAAVEKNRKRSTVVLDQRGRRLLPTNRPERVGDSQAVIFTRGPSEDLG